MRKRFGKILIMLGLFCCLYARSESVLQADAHDDTFFFGESLADNFMDEETIPPVQPVPDAIQKLLKVASGEVGYAEGEHGRTKYGEWAGDPYCQWCAEFLCWCVNQTDQRYGTSLLNNVYPLYSGQNTGRTWFIRNGRYIIRKGPVEDWGYEWLKGHSSFIQSGDYIPQPGDWIFFTWTSDQDTDHVAMVEYCTRSASGNVHVHVIEGNKPSSVSRGIYDINYARILGYGTVHDLADITMSFGNEGEKVRQLQKKLIYLGYLDSTYETGHFGNATGEAVRSFQLNCGIRPSGIANITTQLRLDEEVDLKIDRDPATWTVIDEEDE